MHSYWEEKYWYPVFDYTIIGAGIVGISTAIFLKEKYPRARISVLERSHMGFGASTRNAGFACFGTIGELLDDLVNESEDDVINTISLRWKGLQLLKTLVPEKEMQYLNHGGIELVQDESEFDKYELKRHYINQLIEQASGLKAPIQIYNQNKSSRFYKSCFHNASESQLNPGLMMAYLHRKAVLAGIHIMYSCDVQKIKGNGPYQLDIRNNIAIRCTNLILCTNAFTGHLISGYDIIPARNQVILTQVIDNLDWRGCYHFDRGYIYFREIDGRILIGGARLLDPANEYTDRIAGNEMLENYLLSFLENLQLRQKPRIEYKWSGIIATGKSKGPIITRTAEGIYMGVRLGGMGVAIGAAVAKDLTEQL